MTVSEFAKQECAPIIENAGYEVVEVTFQKNYGVDELTFFIFKKGGISLEDCETVNALIDEPLEKADVTGGKPFSLNVSSSGLDRPITTNADFLRNVGEEVELLFFVAERKKEKTVGILTAMSEKSVSIEMNGKEKTFDRDKIKKIQLNIRF